MKRAIIKNVFGDTFQAELDDPSDWIAANKEVNSWGLPERWQRKDRSNDEEIASALETRTVEDSPEVPATPDSTDADGNVIPGNPGSPAVTHDEIKLPAQYTVTVTDITQEVQQRQVLLNAQRAQEVGNQVLAMVWGVNSSNPNMTPDLFDQILADPDLQLIERLLKNGSLRTAKAKIAALDKPYFTADQKNQVIAILDQSGLAG